MGNPKIRVSANTLEEVRRTLQKLADLITNDSLVAIPTAHASSHQNGGSDEINVTGLSGLLADAQTPLAHTHVKANITDLETITVTPTADAVPKADGTGQIAAGWIPASVGVLVRRRSWFGL